MAKQQQADKGNAPVDVDDPDRNNDRGDGVDHDEGLGNDRDRGHSQANSNGREEDVHDEEWAALEARARRLGEDDEGIEMMRSWREEADPEELEQVLEWERGVSDDELADTIARGQDYRAYQLDLRTITDEEFDAIEERSRRLGDDDEGIDELRQLRENDPETLGLIIEYCDNLTDEELAEAIVTYHAERDLSDVGEDDNHQTDAERNNDRGDGADHDEGLGNDRERDRDEDDDEGGLDLPSGIDTDVLTSGNQTDAERNNDRGDGPDHDEGLGNDRERGRDRDEDDEAAEGPTEMPPGDILAPEADAGPTDPPTGEDSGPLADAGPEPFGAPPAEEGPTEMPPGDILAPEADAGPTDPPTGEDSGPLADIGPDPFSGLPRPDRVDIPDRAEVDSGAGDDTDAIPGLEAPVFEVGDHEPDEDERGDAPPTDSDEPVTEVAEPTAEVDEPVAEVAEPVAEVAEPTAEDVDDPTSEVVDVPTPEVVDTPVAEPSAIVVDIPAADAPAAVVVDVPAGTADPAVTTADVSPTDDDELTSSLRTDDAEVPALLQVESPDVVDVDDVDDVTAVEEVPDPFVDTAAPDESTDFGSDAVPPAQTEPVRDVDDPDTDVDVALAPVPHEVAQADPTEGIDLPEVGDFLTELIEDIVEPIADVFTE